MTSEERLVEFLLNAEKEQAEKEEQKAREELISIIEEAIVRAMKRLRAE